mgnify:CR=1 FL=1
MREGLLKENIDGEALLWAHGRLLERPEQRRLLMVISDGAPVDDLPALVAASCGRSWSVALLASPERAATALFAAAGVTRTGRILVFGDAFNDLQIPYHLTTKEFAQQIRALLKDDGLYLVAPDAGELIAYYANSIAHLIRR